MLLAILPASGASATVLPPDFEERLVASDLLEPVAVAWAPDGRMFIAEKAGRVRVVNPGGDVEPRPLVDITDRVNAFGDRGLLGVAVDSDFANRPWLYLLYTHEIDGTQPDGPKVGRLTRVTVRPENTLEEPNEPETLILGGESSQPCPPPSESVDCLPSDALWHGVGTVRSDPDGTLWVGTGDGANIGSRPDHALRALDLSSPAGKLLHVDREGRGLPGHPFCQAETDLTKTCTKVYARGFRNPFRFSLRTGAGPVVGDVGYSRRDEVDYTAPGRNYGWPCYEGSLALMTDGPCPGFLAADLTSPDHEYEIAGGGAVVAGPDFSAGAFPESTRGVFYGDYGKGIIGRLETDDSGDVTPRSFATGLDGAVVDLEQSPKGALTWVDIGYGETVPGSVREIAYAPGNKTPLPKLAVSQRFGPLPLDVEFDASGTRDPDGDNLTYSWDFGDGSTASGEQVAHAYASAGSFWATLTVSDGETQASRGVRISPGNTPPQVAITDPAPSATYETGGRVRLAGKATDAEDGALKGKSLSWHVVLRHNEHIHGFGQYSGETASFVPTTDHGADSSYEITLTARDYAGLPASTTVAVSPRLVNLTLDSLPSGSPLNFDGADLRTPSTRPAAVGHQAGVLAPSFFTPVGGSPLAFHGWSDGGGQFHAYAVPVHDSRLVASFGDPAGSAAKAAAPALLSIARKPLRASRGGGLPVPIRCLGRSACRGSVTLRQAGRAARSAAPASLGKASFVIPPAKLRRVVVHLTKRARGLLKRRHRLKVTAAVRFRSGGPSLHRASATFPVLRPRKGR